MRNHNVKLLDGEEVEPSPQRGEGSTTLPSIAHHMVSVAQRMHTFTVPELLARLDADVPRRRVYDVLAILLGCGFVAKDPLKKKRYMVQGVEGTREMYQLLHNSKGAAKCPFSKGRPLRCESWNAMNELSHHTDTWMTKHQLMQVVNERRYYDVLGVMGVVGLLKFSRTSGVKLSETVLIPPGAVGDKEGAAATPPAKGVSKKGRKKRIIHLHVVDESAVQAPQVIRPRMMLTVSDEDAVAIWPQLRDALCAASQRTTNEDLFTF